jgi:hypothetical protein
MSGATISPQKSLLEAVVYHSSSNDTLHCISLNILCTLLITRINSNHLLHFPRFRGNAHYDIKLRTLELLAVQYPVNAYHKQENPNDRANTVHVTRVHWQSLRETEEHGRDANEEDGNPIGDGVEDGTKL